MAELKCLTCIHGELCLYRQGGVNLSIISEDCEHYKSAADVVEVVRYKDCDVPHNKWLGCPNLNGLIPPPDFFCGYGEKKTQCVNNTK